MLNPMVIGGFRGIKSVKANCNGVLEGVSCWFLDVEGVR